MMINNNEINKLLDVTELHYYKCWDILCALKGQKFSGELGRAVLDFQFILGDDLFKLGKKYRDIHQERKRIIRRKDKLSLVWFKGRLKKLAEYQEAIKKTIAIGKSIGDGYAWFFYKKERKYFIEHFKHQRNFHIPPGVGGLGELEFINKVKGIEGNLTLYHGITNILRIGDVSFIDLKTFKLTAIGEIKTKRIDKKTIQVKLILIKSDSKKTIKLYQANKADQEKKPIDEDLSNKSKARLDRQLKKMAGIFKEVSKKHPVKNTKIFTRIHLEELNKLYENFKCTQFAYQKAGNGLLLIAYKNRKMRFSTKMFSNSTIDFSLKLENLQKKVLQIVDTTSSENSLGLSSLHYGRDSESHVLVGMIPIFWWPIKLDFLKQIYFQDVLIISIYNHLHLFRKLNRIGFNVEWNSNNKTYNITKRSPKGEMYIENFSYFINLIQDYFFKEDTIIELVERSAKEVCSGNYNSNKIFLAIYQEFMSI